MKREARGEAGGCLTPALIDTRAFHDSDIKQGLFWNWHNVSMFARKQSKGCDYQVIAVSLFDVQEFKLS